jgi:hypothetical protein
MACYFRVERVLLEGAPKPVQDIASYGSRFSFADPTLQALYSILFTVTPYRMDYVDRRVTPDEWKHLT